MTWNNRVVKVKKHGEVYYEIYEAFYDEDNIIKFITENPKSSFGETLEELKEHHKMLEKAFKAPVIEDKPPFKEVESTVNIEPPALDYEAQQLEKLGDLPHLHGDS